MDVEPLPGSLRNSVQISPVFLSVRAAIAGGARRSGQGKRKRGVRERKVCGSDLARSFFSHSSKCTNPSLHSRSADGPNKVVTSPLHAFQPPVHPRLTPRTASALYVFTPNVDVTPSPWIDVFSDTSLFYVVNCAYGYLKALYENAEYVVHSGNFGRG